MGESCAMRELDIPRLFSITSEFFRFSCVFETFIIIWKAWFFYYSQKRKNDLQEIFDRQSGDEEEGSENLAVRKLAPKRKLGAGINGGASKKRKRTSKTLSKWLMEDLERGVMNQVIKPPLNPEIPSLLKGFCVCFGVFESYK